MPTEIRITVTGKSLEVEEGVKYCVESQMAILVDVTPSNEEPTQEEIQDDLENLELATAENIRTMLHGLFSFARKQGGIAYSDAVRPFFLRLNLSHLLEDEEPDKKG